MEVWGGCFSGAGKNKKDKGEVCLVLISAKPHASSGAAGGFCGVVSLGGERPGGNRKQLRWGNKSCRKGNLGLQKSQAGCFGRGDANRLIPKGRGGSGGGGEPLKAGSYLTQTDRFLRRGDDSKSFLGLLRGQVGSKTGSYRGGGYWNPSG